MAQMGGLCPFLSLPLEIRNPIYAYLLSTEYTRKDEMKRIKVSHNRYKGYHYSPVHKYDFQPGILRCNRQINREATAVFHGTNLFVSISHDHISARASVSEYKVFQLQTHCENFGIPVLARGKKARAFRGYAMDIYLGNTRRIDSPELWWNSPKPREWTARPKFMIASDDLLQFCKMFLFSGGRAAKRSPESERMLHLETTMLLVDVLYTTDQHNNPNEFLRPAVRKLLEPLCYLHNIGLVIIKGAVPKLYLEVTTQRIQRQAPSTQNLVHSISSLKEQGDAAFLEGDFRSAARQYQTALDELHAGSQGAAKSERMVIGRYTGLFIGKVKKSLKHKLHLRLAKTNLKLQNYEMAHHWTLAVVFGLHDSDKLLSQMWYCRALASKGLGELIRAYGEIRKARLKQPNDLGILAEIATLSDLLGLK